MQTFTANKMYSHILYHITEVVLYNNKNVFLKLTTKNGGGGGSGVFEELFTERFFEEPKMYFLLYFTNPCAVTNLYDFLSSVEYKIND